MCERLASSRIRNIPCEDVQCDEIWGFVQKKEAHKGPWEGHDTKVGDAYCFVAIVRKTKPVLAHRLRRRTDADTKSFIEDLQRATASRRFQISTDGFKPYVKASVQTRRDRVDFAQLVKVYATSPESGGILHQTSWGLSQKSFLVNRIRHGFARRMSSVRT